MMCCSRNGSDTETKHKQWSQCLYYIYIHRAKQLAFNEKHGITPKGIKKDIKDIIDGIGGKGRASKGGAQGVGGRLDRVAEPGGVYETLDPAQGARRIKELEKQMHKHAENLEFEEAALLRDKLHELRQAVFLPQV